ncbi:hypothetical protein VKT23_015601 [Stygiomarasmius scandens]|uniref:Uncharacterized protein n=1 Tax=Marasmiellus scandens TaxID=2682957 RepID=A0ABR1IXL1_9AGAR
MDSGEGEGDNADNNSVIKRYIPEGTLYSRRDQAKESRKTCWAEGKGEKVSGGKVKKVFGRNSEYNNVGLDM